MARIEPTPSKSNDWTPLSPCQAMPTKPRRWSLHPLRRGEATNTLFDWAVPPGSVGAATPARRPSPVASDDEDGAGLVAEDYGRAVTLTVPSVTLPQEDCRKSAIQDVSLLQAFAKLDFWRGCTHIEIICNFIHERL
jgi:hypothetical protein